MNRIYVRDFCSADNAIDPEVTFATGRFTDADGFVGHLHVHGIGVGLGIDRHRADIQFLAGANDADCDFAAIGYQNFFKHVSEQAGDGR